METDFNNFLRVQWTRTKRNNTVLSRYFNTLINITRLITNKSTFIKLFDEINLFENEMCSNTSRKAAAVKALVTCTRYLHAMTSASLAILNTNYF